MLHFSARQSPAIFGCMAGRELFPILNVQDIRPVQRFYEAVFGAVVLYRFPESGDPVYVTLRVGGSELALGVGTEPAMYGETPLPATGHPQRRA